MKIIFTIFLLFLLPDLSAQEKTRYLEDRTSTYFSLQIGNAIGKYQSTLKESGGNIIDGGLVLGHLWNPYGNKKPSTVFCGGEIGFQSGGSDKILTPAIGNFKAKFNQYWLNGVARYRPILGNSKLNPFIDAFFGGKFINTTVIEILSEDETETLVSERKLVPNYGLGVGTGFKLSGKMKNSYIDFGIYYQQSEPIKIVKRNSIEINKTYQVSYKKVLTNTNQILFKIGITGFFSR